MNKKNWLVFFFGILAISCSHKNQQQEVVVFHAGSLSYPMKSLIDAFNKEYPEIRIVNEAAGSLETARKVTEINRKADIIALADYQIIDQLLIPRFTNFNIHFATNSIGIAYKEKSHNADVISKNNWSEVLLDEDVRFGASDPNADPCGYRTRMLILLQEKLSGDTLLSSRLFSSKRYHQRPKETDLIALLETGTVDYIFLYESVSKQHGLMFLPLMDSINLSEPALNDWYAEAKLAVRGSSEGSQILLAAEAITYGLTLLDDAPNKENALVFLRWLLHNEKGLAQMRSNGFDALNPPRLTYEGNFPEFLKNIHLQKIN